MKFLFYFKINKNIIKFYFFNNSHYMANEETKKSSEEDCYKDKPIN